MSDYKELVERCREIAIQYDGNPSTVSDFILAEVLRTLETVTPEMLDAASLDKSTQIIARAVWLAMLDASPVAPK